MKKKAIVSIFAMVLTLSMILITSYAYFRPKGGVISTPTSITTKNLDLTVDYTGNVATVFNDIMPMPDNVAITKPGFEFSVTNDSDDWQFYKISIADLGIIQNETKINSLDLKLNISEKNNPRLLNTYTYTELKDGVLLNDHVNPNETKEYVLRAWINEDCDNDSLNGSFNAQIVIEGMKVPDSYKLFDDHHIIRSYNNGVVGCNTDHSICSVFTDIKSALNYNFFTVSDIFVYGDVSLNSEVTIEEGRDITIDLNGGSLLRSQTGDGIDVFGSLTMNDSLGTGNYYNSYTGGARLIATLGSLTINGGRYITDGDEAPFRSGKSGNTTGQVIVNNGSFYINNPEESDAIFKIYSNNSNPLVINNIFAYLEATSLFSIGSGIADLSNTHIDINGGIIVGNNAPEIFVNKQSIVNITATNKPLYILGKQKDGEIVIQNNDNLGVINISAPLANACLKEPLATTTGLCVFAEGNKEYEHTEANGAVINKKDGTINIDGGTYYGGYQGIYNYNNGTINIKNAQIISGRYALVNGRSSSYNSTMTICSSTLNSGYRDIKQNTKAGLNYYDVTFKDGTKTLDSNNIKNSAGSVTELDSCPF